MGSGRKGRTFPGLTLYGQIDILGAGAILTGQPLASPLVTDPFLSRRVANEVISGSHWAALLQICLPVRNILTGKSALATVGDFHRPLWDEAVPGSFYRLTVLPRSSRIQTVHK